MCWTLTKLEMESWEDVPLKGTKRGPQMASRGLGSKVPAPCTGLRDRLHGPSLASQSFCVKTGPEMG